MVSMCRERGNSQKAEAKAKAKAKAAAEAGIERHAERGKQREAAAAAEGTTHKAPTTNHQPSAPPGE